MKTLYLDCGMGAAGDMLTAALLELLPDRAALMEELNALGIPGVKFIPKKCEKCGITGTYMGVIIHGEEYLSMEELQAASGVGPALLDRLRQIGALGDMPESSQVSFF